MSCRVEIVMDCVLLLLLLLLVVMEGKEESRKARKLGLWVLAQSCWFG
jgi:hypothetical protein